MLDSKQTQQVQEASWDVINSLRETNQAVADSFASIQDRNLRFAENLFLSWTELLTQQAENVQHLQQQWGHQTRKQQDAFQKLASASMRMYVDFFLTPISFSQRIIDVTRTTREKEKETIR
jgi:hypothetical protein